MRACGSWVVEAQDGARYVAPMDLFRGMKNMRVDVDEFQRTGATEMACMSTTAVKAVALKYASSAQPLLFRYKTRGNSRGVSIQYLSMFLMMLAFRALGWAFAGTMMWIPKLRL